MVVPVFITYSFTSFVSFGGYRESSQRIFNTLPVQGTVPETYPYPFQTEAVDSREP